jgi:hypothetical protein
MYAQEEFAMTEMETTEISVAYPEAPDLQLRITVGACRLTVAPGDGEEWVSGSYQAPSGALPVKVQQEGGNLRITQEYRLAGIGGVLSRVPRLDLKLGKANPYGLSLETGATESTSDLGGLPVTRMVVKQGAGKIYFDFSAPNPQSMSLLDLDAGAVNLEMRNLANANFAEMRVDGGAAAYKFDFGGNLQRDANVRITAGMSSVEVSVPAATAAKIYTETVLAQAQVGDGFMKKEGAWWTPAAVEGKSPLLTVHGNVSLGQLTVLAT